MTIGRRTVALTALGSLAALASSGLASPSVRAQPAWPTKPIRLIVPYGPGGSADQVARLYAEKMSGVLGQQIVVEDKPGASGGVAALPEIKEKLLMVAQNVEHQPWDRYAAQVRDDRAYFAKLLKELDIKLE